MSLVSMPKSNITSFQIGDMFHEGGSSCIYVLLGFNNGELVLTLCDTTGRPSGHAEMSVSLDTILDCLKRGQLIYLKKQVVAEQPKQVCTCDVKELMRNGCKCGGFKAEQQRKKAS